MDTFSCESQMIVAKQATDEQTQLSQLRRSVTSLHIPWPIYSHTKLQTNRGHYKTEVTEILSEENP